ncbi:MAG: ATP-binding protein [Paludibacteraceae bacterium]|nr:ATP-binding protein [Paludibacteraceae bacterium]MBO5553793.1 ATP-binding protein [Paludibacteraceae bacterium]
MQAKEKEQIRTALQAFCERKGSQNKAATALKGVSSATVSQVLNGNWDLITDEMWRNIASQIGYDRQTWNIVETRGYKRMTDLLGDAQANSLVLAVTGDAGCGKSEAVKRYEASHKNVYHLCCSEFWNRKHFMTELLRKMSVEHSGYTVAEMMEEIVTVLKKQDTPLIVLDEADKLSDQVLYFFISLYNALEDHCGIILCATQYLEKRIKRGIRQERKGYREIYSRFGKRFIPLQVVNADDIRMVCLANGIEDESDIESVINDSDNDLRRVKRRIHGLKTMSK